jgi:hypothetical protein
MTNPNCTLLLLLVLQLYVQICEIMLFSEGFEGAKALAKKMTVCAQLLQTTTAVHFTPNTLSLLSTSACLTLTSLACNTLLTLRQQCCNMYAHTNRCCTS